MIRKELNEMIEFFIANGCRVHIKLSTGRFYNGLILKYNTDAVITFKDRIVGDMHIFLNQIDKIEEYTEVSS